jgi:hypothetical protein
MHWYQDEEEEEADLMFSPALLARRASESWIDSAPIEVSLSSANFQNRSQILILTKLFFSTKSFRIFPST